MKESALVGGVDTSTALVLALLSTLALAALHQLVPSIRKLPLVPEHAAASFAGGLAVSYVFLHLLPEVAYGHSELRERFDEGPISPLAELGIFLVALTGFCVFYGLEILAQRVSTDERTGARQGGVFWVHLGAFALYNAIITYTLSSTYRTGVAFALLFTIAMGLHFVLSDRGLEEHYGRRFDRRLPRLVLLAGLLLGWLLSALFAPTRSVTVSVLTAFLAGSVLLNVFKEEIPSARRSSFRWFLTGLLGYAALLTTVTALE